MAYGEKLLNVSDLLSMWQNRHMNEQQNRGNDKQRAIQNEMAEQQLEAAKTANEKSRLELGLLTPTGMPNATDSPYSIGYPDYAKAQERDKLLSLMHGGKAYTGIGDFGSVGRGGGGGGGGPTPTEDARNVAQTNLFEEQGRKIAKERSGYGSGMADMVVQQKMQNELDQAAAQRQNESDIAAANRENQLNIAKMLSETKENVAGITTGGKIAAKESAAETKAIDQMYNDKNIGNPAYQNMPPAMQSKTLEFYSQLTSSPQWKKLLPEIQNYAIKELPNIMGFGRGATVDLPTFIKRIKEEYANDYIKSL